MDIFDKITFDQDVNPVAPDGYFIVRHGHVVKFGIEKTVSLIDPKDIELGEVHGFKPESVFIKNV